MMRLLDIIFSVIGLFCLFPLLLIISLILKLTGEGKVFFLQDRIGEFGGVFRIIKFATMLEDSPNIGTKTVTVRDDPRVLPVGKYLRKTKINELPQLVNVLRGEMSLVGPRPVSQREFDAFTQNAKDTIVMIKPGVTGISSLVFRDEERITSTYDDPILFYRDVLGPYKGDLEIWYFENKTVHLYLSIIALTIVAVLLPNTHIALKLFALPDPPIEIRELLYRS